MMQNSQQNTPEMPDLLTASAEIRQGERSSVSLVESCLTQIKNHNPTLNAFGDVYNQQALEDAEACDNERKQGKLRGPLHGVPFGIKDLFSTAGLRTTKGSLTGTNNVPDTDAPIIERLKAAGAIIIGKTATTEFGWSGASYSRVFGHGRNPGTLS
ncbi:amidase [Mangrovibacter sp. SLW1]